MHLVSCSALDWRVAIVVERMAPMAKPARVGPLGTTWTPLTQNGLVLRFGQGCLCTSFKKSRNEEIDKISRRRHQRPPKLSGKSTR